jgi:hypothetical protein
MSKSLKDIINVGGDFGTTENTHSNNNILYVEPTLYGRGNINPFSSRVNTSHLTINTLFRPNYNNTLSTDFIVDLPQPLTKVASYQLESFSCLPVFYNVSSQNGSNKMKFVIINPPMGIVNSYVNVELESGVYQPSNITGYFNYLFQSSSNGLQFLKCEQNTISKKIVFRARSFWYDGYLTQLDADGNVVLGGGPFDELIIDPNDYTQLIPNPFYSPTCSYLLDFTTEHMIARPIYRNLGWVMGFTFCRYEISMDSSYTYYQDPYYNFYSYFKSPVPGYTNDLFLQRQYGIDTASLTIYGVVQGDHIFVDRTLIPDTGVYIFLDIDDYNKNYDPSGTTALGENFDTSFSATTFAKINIATTNVSIDNLPNRVFFGPVNLKRLHIRLLNGSGEVFDYPGDYSITLKIQRIY